MQEAENKNTASNRSEGNSKQDENGGSSESLDLTKAGGQETSAASTILTKVKDTAGEAYNSVADGASSMIDEKKSELTTGLTGIAQTVRRVSEAITGGEESAEGITGSASNYVESAAAKLEGVADYFDSHDLRAMAGDVQDYARRNPVVFLGGAFVVGVLAARFLKSRPLDTASQRSTSRNTRGRQQNRGRSSSASASAA